MIVFHRPIRKAITFGTITRQRFQIFAVLLFLESNLSDQKYWGPYDYRWLAIELENPGGRFGL
uniref:Uncharacterized protein n=1 Tax=Romanomermis culicivorax TaxID=13658 RepID=A0A915JLV5_ROMCU